MNEGIYPADTTTPEGQLRVSLGDTAFTEIGPEPTPPNTRPEPRMVSYANFSDEKLAQLVADGEGSILRAKSYAYAELSATVSHLAITVKTNDLSYSGKDGAEALLKLAEYWSTEADKQDDLSSDDAFEIVGYPGRDDENPVLPHLL